MSSRAAWRLQSLGFSNVHRYTAGKTDWLSNGLPSEGKLTSEQRIGRIAHRDTPTCRLGQRIADIHTTQDLCVVLNEAGVIMGDLRGSALHGNPDTPVEQAMNPGPSTYRPNVSVKEMAHHLLDSGAKRVLVADADGRLIGWISRDDVVHALDEEREHHKHHKMRHGPILATLTSA
jgi:CBS domain protein